MDWKGFATVYATTLEAIIKKLENASNTPTELADPVSNLSNMLLNIESLSISHQKYFKRFVERSSSLVAILGHLYDSEPTYKDIWPPPSLNRAIEGLVKTVGKAHKLLLARKCSKGFMRKKIFVVLDLGKIKKYLFKLDSVATYLKNSGRDKVVDIDALLLKAILAHQHPRQDVNTKISSQEQPVAEGSGQKGSEISRRSTKQTVKSEEIEEGDSVEYESLASKTRKASSGEEPVVAPRAVKYSKNIPLGAEEGIEMESRYREKDARKAQTPVHPTNKKRKKEKQGHRKEEAPYIHPGNKKKAQKRTSNSPPTTSNSPGVSHTSINSHGSGSVISQSFGDIVDSNISNIGNNNSRTYHYYI